MSEGMKVALVVLADTETHADMGRVANALEAAKEFHEAGDEVLLLFDGAGTKWIGELARSDHPLHRSFEAARDTISGACRYCAAAFGATDGVRSAGIALLGEYEGHPSLRKLVTQGYQVITF
jgi:hypothetical protein